MKLTNKLALPDPIVRAIRNDGYNRGEKTDFSVTQLISSPRIRVLQKRHWHELEDDVADRIYSLLGQSIHTILERAEVSAKVEERLYAEVDGMMISGQFDRMALIEEGDSHVLQDWKVCSIWVVADGHKLEWEQQLNMLRWLAVQNGHIVTALQIAAIFRDWSKSKAKRDANYPQHPVQIVNIPVWPLERTLAYIKERVRVHVEAEWTMPDCTPEERWYRGEQWAVRKKTNKRATKLFDFRDHAEEFAKTDKNFVVEHRPGTNTRCLDYCQVAEYCEQWKALQAAQAESESLVPLLRASLEAVDG